MRRVLVVLALLVTAGCGGADPGSTPSSASTSPSMSTTGSATPSPTETPSAGGQLPADAPTTLAEVTKQISQAASGVVPPVDADRVQTDDSLYCNLTGGQLADVTVLPMCEVLFGKVSAPRYCAGVDTQLISRIELRDGVPTPVCDRTTLRSGKTEPRLRVGQVTAAGPGRALQCLGITDGVACVTADGTKGFVLTSAAYLLL